MGLFRRKKAAVVRTDRPDDRGTAKERRHWLFFKKPQSNGEAKKKKKKKKKDKGRDKRASKVRKRGRS